MYTILQLLPYILAYMTLSFLLMVEGPCEGLCVEAMREGRHIKAMCKRGRVEGAREGARIEATREGGRVEGALQEGGGAAMLCRVPEAQKAGDGGAATSCCVQAASRGKA